MRTAILVGIGLACTGASGQTVNLFAQLDGLQEVPPVVTPGIGGANVTINLMTRQVTIVGDIANLTSPMTGVHLHGFAPPGQEAPAIAPINFPESTGGVISNQFVLSQTQIDGLIAGLCYINVHTQNNLDGEIRGQIVPAPGAIGAALAFALAARRRR